MIARRAGLAPRRLENAQSRELELCLASVLFWSPDLAPFPAGCAYQSEGGHNSRPIRTKRKKEIHHAKLYDAFVLRTGDAGCSDLIHFLWFLGICRAGS